MTIEARFWAKVDKSGDCWLWTACVVRRYGMIGHNGQLRRAHRVAWELAHGPIPDGLWVLHRCDTPLCVRPDHLILGTPADNSADMVAKGRVRRGANHPMRLHPEALARGERNGLTSLTSADVLAIRTRASRGESQRSLAAAFGVSQPTIGNVVHRRTWGHI